MGKTILIVEDEQNIVDILSFNLSREGYDTLEAYDGPAGLQLALENDPDLILLDLMLPGLSGEEILPQIADIPVIVMSAKADIKGKVSLLLNGAADYITKPFEIEELLARIIVQFRKTSGSTSSNVLKYDCITLNPATREVLINSQNVRLTKTEFAILKLLMENPKQIITKTILLDRISEDTPDCMESSLRVHISNLRKKLRDVSGKDHIEAVWGIGFKMAEN